MVIFIIKIFLKLFIFKFIWNIMSKQVVYKFAGEDVQSFAFDNQP